MAEASVPVDLLNPGQVFACLGFAEAAEVLLGDARGGFDWSEDAGARFHLAADGDADPVEAVLTFLAGARVSALAPAGSANRTEKWDVATILLADGDPYSGPDPASPATLPACLEDEGGRSVIIDHWTDGSTRDLVKFWAGSGGYPGVALLRDALDLIREKLPNAASDPFALSAHQSSSFRFDWRRDYVPLDAGFSPNAHGDVIMLGFPIVEILAAIGLTHARPDREERLLYRYYVMGSVADGGLSPLGLLRASLGARLPPFLQRTFRMRLGWPGQEGQARCIVETIEETES